MPFVERNAQREIVGIYYRPQPGYAEEFVEDDAAEVAAFQESFEPKPPRKVKAPPSPKGSTVAALRTEVAELRQKLIDAGLLAP